MSLRSKTLEWYLEDELTRLVREIDPASLDSQKWRVREAAQSIFRTIILNFGEENERDEHGC